MLEATVKLKLFCNLVVAKSTTRVVVVATHSHGHQIIAIIDPWGHVWPDHSDHEVDAVVWLALDWCEANDGPLWSNTLRPMWLKAAGL